MHFSISLYVCAFPKIEDGIYFIFISAFEMQQANIAPTSNRAKKRRIKYEEVKPLHAIAIYFAVS